MLLPLPKKEIPGGSRESRDLLFAGVVLLATCHQTQFLSEFLRLHFAKKCQNLSKRVMRDLGVLSGVLACDASCTAANDYEDDVILPYLEMCLIT